MNLTLEQKAILDGVVSSHKTRQGALDAAYHALGFPVDGIAIVRARQRVSNRKGGTARYLKLLQPPADFATIAPTLSRAAAVRRWGHAPQVLQRFADELGVAFAAPTLREVPDDFVVRAPTMTRTEAREVWGTSDRVINRWTAETGVEFRSASMRAPKPASQPFTRAPAERNPKAGVWRQATGGKSALFVRRDYTVAGQAADFMQKHGPTHRCDALGKADEFGNRSKEMTHWRHWNAVLTDAELIERAVRKGFDPQAWARIAA